MVYWLSGLLIGREKEMFYWLRRRRRWFIGWEGEGVGLLVEREKEMVVL